MKTLEKQMSAIHSQPSEAYLYSSWSHRHRKLSGSFFHTSSKLEQRVSQVCQWDLFPIWLKYVVRYKPAYFRPCSERKSMSSGIGCVILEESENIPFPISRPTEAPCSLFVKFWQKCSLFLCCGSVSIWQNLSRCHPKFQITHSCTFEASAESMTICFCRNRGWSFPRYSGQELRKPTFIYLSKAR